MFDNKYLCFAFIMTVVALFYEEHIYYFTLDDILYIICKNCVANGGPYVVISCVSVKTVTPGRSIVNLPFRRASF